MVPARTIALVLVLSATAATFAQELRRTPHTRATAGLPDLLVNVGLYNDVRVDPAEPSSSLINVANVGSEVSSNVVLTITAPDGGTLDSVVVEFGNVTCGPAGTTITCTAPSIAPDDSIGLDVPMGDSS